VKAVKRLAAPAFVAVLAALSFSNSYAGGYPEHAAVPKLPIAGNSVRVADNDEVEFVLRDKTEVQKGRTWLGYLDYRKAWGGDPRDALAGIVGRMQKSGWEVLLRDEPRNPPLATLKRVTKDNKELWASVEVFDKARVLVLEPVR
jgi:hypothetical protein